MGKNECGLTPEIESIVSDWQLYRPHGTPPLFTLEYYGTSQRVYLVKLTVGQLLSFRKVTIESVKQNSTTLPIRLGKYWGYVVGYLIDHQKIIESTCVNAKIARHILYTCLRGVHSVEAIKDYQNGSLRSEFVFRQGIPRFPDAFWFKFDTMFLEVNENFRDSKTTRANISKLLGKCGAVNKRLSNHWTIRRERMMCLDSNAFKSLCEIAGVEWTIGDLLPTIDS